MKRFSRCFPQTLPDGSPGPVQLDWHDVEICVTIGLGVNTFADRGMGAIEPSELRPTLQEAEAEIN